MEILHMHWRFLQHKVKNNTKWILLAAFFMAATLSSTAQPFDSVLKKLDSRYPQEKLYLQLDKNSYNPGETIWCKAYLFSGIFPSGISKTIYTELLDQDGKLLDRRSAPVVFSSAATAFDLPAKLKGNTVYVRAYTKWMLNFDSSFIYTRPVTIINPDAKPAAAAAPVYSLSFFPEGGDLVNSVESRVAFKGTDAHGLPVKLQGDIKDSRGQKIGSFSAVHDGMGYFKLTPEKDLSYTAFWKDPAGKMHQTKLPEASSSGAVLEANMMASGIQFIVRKPLSDNAATLPYVYVVAQMQQQLLYRARAGLTATSVISGVIPTQNIPAGIVQITVFGPDDMPLAERIVFVNKPDYYFITDLNSAITDLGKRKKNVIQVDVPDTIPCNLSVSVTDVSVNPPNVGEPDIFSGLLLTSDIHGYVHNPAYYFSSDADSVKQLLDLVMMTNGWRRFRWKEVLSNHWPAIKYYPDNYLSIDGKVNGLTKTELVQRELTGFIVLKNGSQQLINIPVQTDGHFAVPGLLFYDTAKIYYQFNNDKEKVLTSKALIDFNSDLLVKPFGNKPDSMLAYQHYVPTPALVTKAKELFKQQEEKRIEDRKKVSVLDAVTVTAKKKSKEEQMDEEYTSGFFSGGDGYTFVTEDDPFANASQSVLQYLQGKVAGLQITVSGPNASLSWRGGTPGLFLNEMQGDVSMIQNLSMSDVAMIKVFRPPFFGGAGGSGAGGAIAVYTKKGKAANDNVKGLDFASIPGYTPVREFYSPDYSKIENLQNTDSDIRSTLYWNPFVFTDKDHRRIYLTFYNNDITKKYRVVIEGINTDGKLTRIEKNFE